MLRTMQKARYDSINVGHFGLAAGTYTHFTSPIRRYSDLVVHRVFDYYLIKHAGWPMPPGYQFGYNAGKMDSLGEHLSLTETNSQEAERESVKIKLLEFFERELAKKKKTAFAAIITDVRQHGFFVELEESMTFGFVPAASLGDDYLFQEHTGGTLVGRRTKKRFSLGARIEVEVFKVDRQKRLIDFRAAV